MPGNAGGDVIDQLDAGELDDAVIVLGVEPGRLGVEDKFAHEAPSMRSVFVEIGPALVSQRRPFQDLPDNCIDLAVRVFQRDAGIHNEVGFRALGGVGPLAREIASSFSAVMPGLARSRCALRIRRTR